MRKKNKGQVLLLVVLLSATFLAIAGAIFFETTVQTQLTKMQEESIRALKTAESLAEQALQQNSSITLAESGIQMKGAAGEAKLESAQVNPFTTPLLFRDEQYMVYFYDYSSSSPGPAQTITFRINPEDSNLCNSWNRFTVELTYVNLSDGSFSRDVVACSGSGIPGARSFGSSLTSPSAHILIVRLLDPDINFPGTRLLIERLDGSKWPPQGIQVISTVQTASGVTKTLKIFQSHPQIPAAFFVTKF